MNVLLQFVLPVSLRAFCVLAYALAQIVNTTVHLRTFVTSDTVLLIPLACQLPPPVTCSVVGNESSQLISQSHLVLELNHCRRGGYLGGH